MVARTHAHHGAWVSWMRWCLVSCMEACR
jgi:hypothetical protein